MKLFEVLSVLLFIKLSVEETIVEKRINHKPINILDDKLSTISKASQLDHLKQTVTEILIPRIVGTEGHDKVRDFIIKSLEKLELHIERDIFEEDTPNFGRLQFENIIATLNPNAERFLVLACHYDSKHMPNEVFLGATDSAVPCAMLINLVHVLKTYLDKAKTNNDLSLKLVFFDGEEAFQEWTSTDSIYGARHLATKWNGENFLERIDMLMLLDLIGAPDPKFYSFFHNTVNWYSRLISIEERLAAGDNFVRDTTMSPSKAKEQRFFQALSADSYIEDDHIPFLRLGVPILHLIPVPFPDVWHKVGDNHDIIDYTTVENINKVLGVFIIEYLNIEI